MWLWLGQYRFTPEAAIRSQPASQGAIVRTAPFPGGVALLQMEGAQYKAYAVCRRWQVFWQVCSQGGFTPAAEGGPVIEMGAWNARGEQGDGVALLAGVVTDQRVERIAWGELEQAVKGTGHFLFARLTPMENPFPPALALSDAGEPLYKWSGDTFYRWQPVVHASDVGPALGFIPVPRDRGDWSTAHSDPGVAARQFVLAGGTCDCKQVVVGLRELHADGLTYTVRLEGLKDDSVQTLEYRVRLKRSGELWQVDAATYHTICGRGFDPSGYCS